MCCRRSLPPPDRGHSPRRRRPRSALPHPLVQYLPPLAGDTSASACARLPPELTGIHHTAVHLRVAHSRELNQRLYVCVGRGGRQQRCWGRIVAQRRNGHGGAHHHSRLNGTSLAMVYQIQRAACVVGSGVSRAIAVASAQAISIISIVFGLANKSIQLLLLGLVEGDDDGGFGGSLRSSLRASVRMLNESLRGTRSSSESSHLYLVHSVLYAVGSGVFRCTLGIVLQEEGARCRCSRGRARSRCCCWAGASERRSTGSNGGKLCLKVKRG